MSSLRLNPESAMTGAPSPLGWIPNELEQLAARGLLRRRRSVTPLADGWCVVDGRKLRNLASNDYLNLAQHPRVVAAAERALQECGAGAGASALVCGRTHWHAALEERLARFEDQAAAILFPTGYAANSGTVGALVGAGDAIYSDALNHASLVEGCRLSGARVHVYPHRDLDELENALQKSPPGGRRLIVTDGVFSMDGAVAPLANLCDLAERFNAMLLVDEAHGTGVFGERGRGACELAGVEDRVTVRVGTLSKAIGSQGGFVTGPTHLIDWLWNKARTQTYSTALTPSACAAAIAAIDIIEAEPERRTHLLRLSTELRAALTAADVATIPNSMGPIVPVVLKSAERALQVADRLEAAGYLVGSIRPPTVPAGTSRLRISLKSGLTSAEVARFASILGQILSRA